MLKHRILTALLLIPLVLGAVLWLPSDGFALVIAIVMALAGWEWSQLCGWQHLTARAIYAVLIGGGAVGVWFAGSGPLFIAIIYFALVAWLLAIGSIKAYPRGIALWQKSRAARAIVGFVVLLPAGLGMALIHQWGGAQHLLLLLFIIWAADTGAYFAGRRWGRHKLAPTVSPGKSWEGVAGGAAAVFVVSALGYSIIQPPYAIAPFAFLIAVILVLSIVGDLFESMFKRIVGVKDSGGLLPGHGGILDRIDSLTSAAPFYAAGLHWLGGGS